MARKQKFEGGTKNRIIDVGGQMFLENGAEPVMDIHTSAIYLAHALGGCVLKEDEAWVAVAKPQLLQSVKVLMGLKD